MASNRCMVLVATPALFTSQLRTIASHLFPVCLGAGQAGCLAVTFALRHKQQLNKLLTILLPILTESRSRWAGTLVQAEGPAQHAAPCPALRLNQQRMRRAATQCPNQFLYVYTDLGRNAKELNRYMERRSASPLYSRTVVIIFHHRHRHHRRPLSACSAPARRSGKRHAQRCGVGVSGADCKGLAWDKAYGHVSWVHTHTLLQRAWHTERLAEPGVAVDTISAQDPAQLPL